MKKLLPTLLALLLLLTACGASGGNSSMKQDADADMPASNTTAGGGWIAEEESAPMEPMGAPEMPVPAPESAGADLPKGEKLIYSAQLSLETKAFDDAGKALDMIVEKLGGYYESHSLEQGGSYRSLYCTIRVPAENFSALLEQVGQAAHMTRCQQYTEDVSEVYYDTEARLKTQQTKLDRLHVLLEQADTMEDIIALESALSDTELAIEQLTGSLRHYDSLVGYSTVELELYEVYKLSTDPDDAPLTFGQRMASAFSTGLRRGVDGAEDLLVGLARNWVTVLVLTGGVLAVVLVLRRRMRRNTAKEKPAQPQDETKI